LLPLSPRERVGVRGIVLTVKFYYPLTLALSLGERELHKTKGADGALCFLKAVIPANSRNPGFETIIGRQADTL